MSAAPGAPTGLHVEPITSSSLRLTWLPPHDVISSSRHRVNGYVISCSDADLRQTITATVTSPEVTWYTVGGLAAYTAYRVHVTVRSALGHGPSTPTTWARTLEAGQYQPPASSVISAIIWQALYCEIVRSFATSGRRHFTHAFLKFTYTRPVQPVATCRQSPYLHKPAIVKLLLLICSFQIGSAFHATTTPSLPRPLPSLTHS